MQYPKLFKLLKKNITYSRASIVLIFFSSIAFSLIVLTYSKNYYENIAKERFETTVSESLKNIKDRMYSYENILRSGVGFLYASDSVTRNDWHDFITTLDMKINYPGMQGVGFSKMLKPEEVTEVEQNMRKDAVDPLSLTPVEDTIKEYSAILFIEPMDKRNVEVIGYDMFSEPKRHKAMEKARDTGLPAITKKVTLVQEIDSDIQPGILMYLPVYKKGTKTDDFFERREALLGFVYSPFRMNDLIRNTNLKKSIINFKIYDSEDISDEHFLYSSFKPYSHAAKYKCIKTLNIMNLTWHIHFASTPQFDASTRSPYPLWITLGGLITNFFLLLIVLALVKSLQNLQIQAKKNKEQTSYMLYQSRLAQMGEMISMIAHQWRQPLSSISAISGAMSIDVVMDNYDKKFFGEQLESIDNLSQHLSSTIDDFREFFKDNKLKRESTVKKIIEGTLQIIGSSFEAKNIELIFEQKDDVKIYTHVNELKQVILNILKNAEDALIEKRDSNFKIWISWHVENEYVNISIEDNAGGIPQEIIKSVFEPYFSTKQTKNGTGLGLYMSKTIVEEHCEGILSVANTRRGAKFTIVLPDISEESVDNLF